MKTIPQREKTVKQRGKAHREGKGGAVFSSRLPYRRANMEKEKERRFKEKGDEALRVGCSWRRGGKTWGDFRRPAKRDEYAKRREAVHGKLVPTGKEEKENAWGRGVRGGRFESITAQN